MTSCGHTIGDYEIVRTLGTGGMATVYLARQQPINRLVALKQLMAIASGPEQGASQRFLGEARVAGALDHPNIVTVHEYFEDGGTPFIAMEYIEQGSLRPWVGRLSLPQVAGTLEAVLAGLDHAWSRGVVHRDLKPENLMITSRGELKIVDFGIAKAYWDVAAAEYRTAKGSTIGTPAYIAPEQAMGLDPGPWSDLYTTGIIAFELITGELPFRDTGEPMALMLRHAHEVVPDMRSVDPHLDPELSGWVARMVEKQPAARFPDAASAWSALQRVVVRLAGPLWRGGAALGVSNPSARSVIAAPPFAGDGSANWPSPPVLEPPHPAASTRSVLAGVVVGGLVVVAGILGALRPWETQPSHQPVAEPPSRLGEDVAASVAGDGSLWISDPNGRVKRVERRASAGRVGRVIVDPAGPTGVAADGVAVWFADNTGLTHVGGGGRITGFPGPAATALALSDQGNAVVVQSRSRRICSYSIAALHRKPPCARVRGLPVAFGATGSAAFVGIRDKQGVTALLMYSLPVLGRKPQITQAAAAQLPPPHGPVLEWHQRVYVPIAGGVAVLALLPSGLVPAHPIRLPATPSSIWIAPRGELFAALPSKNEVVWRPLAANGPAGAAPFATPIAIAGGPGARAPIYVVSRSGRVGILDPARRTISAIARVGRSREQELVFGRPSITLGAAGDPMASIPAVQGRLPPISLSRSSLHLDADRHGTFTVWQPGLRFVPGAAGHAHGMRIRLDPVKNNPDSVAIGVTIDPGVAPVSTVCARVASHGQEVLITAATTCG